MGARIPKKAARIVAPKQERSAVTVRAIEQATDELVAERGLDALTAQDAAKRAGVSPGTLFRYFRTRAALISDWEVRSLRVSVSQLFAIVEDTLTRPQPMDVVIWGLSYKAALLVFQYLRHAAKPEDRFDALRERLVLIEGAVTTFAAAAEASPERSRLIPNDVPLAMSVAVHATSFTAYGRALSEHSEEQEDVFAREIADMVTRYLVRPLAP